LVTVENISGALASTAFLSYLGNLCTNKQYTATQYSIVSSLTSLGRVLISASSGFIVDFYGWSIFFLLCTIIAFIPLLVFKQIKKTF
jgi:PAT family beta-lactamase induction signal transducer AmpG